MGTPMSRVMAAAIEWSTWRTVLNIASRGGLTKGISVQFRVDAFARRVKGLPGALSPGAESGRPNPRPIWPDSKDIDTQESARPACPRGPSEAPMTLTSEQVSKPAMLDNLRRMLNDVFKLRREGAA